MTAVRTARRRCAIYTRKSTDEGLEQAFNSLDAQREACQAYIRSQVGEGWTALEMHYDDGGYSGGTMDRPALEQLLADKHEDVYLKGYADGREAMRRHKPKFPLGDPCVMSWDFFFTLNRS